MTRIIRKIVEIKVAGIMGYTTWDCKRLPHGTWQCIDENDVQSCMYLYPAQFEQFCLEAHKVYSP